MGSISSIERPTAPPDVTAPSSTEPAAPIVAPPDATVIINQIDVALRRYYKALNRDYDREFALYCEENAIDDDFLQDDLNEEPQDSMLIDFDDNFPFQIQPKDEESKQTFIHQFIKRCYDDPNSVQPSFVFTEVNEDFFKIRINEIKDFIHRLNSQCPQISYFQEDEPLMTVMPIENKQKIDYLFHLYDAFHRDKINEYLFHLNDALPQDKRKTLCLNEWIHVQESTHFQCLKRFKSPLSGQYSICDMVRSALHSLKRLAPLLKFEGIGFGMYQINDSLEITVRYICSIIDWIHHIIKNSEELMFPFQVDFCIKYGAVISKCPLLYDEEDDDDDDDEDNKDDDIGNELIIGDIKPKLEKNGLRYGYIECDNNSVSNVGFNMKYAYVIMGWMRMKAKIEHIPSDIIGVVIKYVGGNIFTLYDTFMQTMDDTTFPKYKRMITLVDRRKRLEKDDLWMYECPSDCRNIPKDAVSFWYFNASQTCLLPNIEYDEDDPYRGFDENIGVRSRVGGSLLTFSFHVKNKDCIRCYLHWNGAMMRFRPQYIKSVLPIIFAMETYDNQEFVRNDELTKELIDRMNKTLVDREFDAFCALHLPKGN